MAIGVTIYFLYGFTTAGCAASASTSGEAPH